MTERETTEILLVRSVEETDPDYFPPDVQVEALIASGEEEDDIALVRKRAHHLFQQLPETLRDIPQTVHIPRKWSAVACIGVFSLGIIFNYLGPGDKIHVIYNPVVLLILWNICVFAVFLARHFFRKKNGVPKETAQPCKTDRHIAPPAVDAGPARPDYTSSVFLWIFRKIWFSLHQQISKRKHDIKQIPKLANMASRYLQLWWGIKQNIFFSRFTRYVHILAVCLVMGALTGAYMRGLFFEYNVIWKSTFIHDAKDIALILNAIFGVPSKLLQGTFVDEQGISILKSANGQPAAPWIHLFAVSAFVYVIPQRAVLMLLESWRLRSLSNKIMIDTEEPYYSGCITLAREMKASRLRGDISAVVQAEISKLSDSVALYARTRLYDEKIVPQLLNFRNNGGRISDLEHVIVQESENFKAELDGFLGTAGEDLSRSVAEGVSAVIGKKLSAIRVNVGSGFRIKSEVYRDALNWTVTDTMTSSISLAVTGAVAATMGTVSGGFGKVLGVAVISTLLHTTGPVGFLIGALAGLLLGGSASVLARDKITDAVKNRSFPGFSTRMLLGESRMNRMIEEGRTRLYASIRRQIEDKLIEHKDEVTDQILSNITSPRSGHS